VFWLSTRERVAEEGASASESGLTAA
jgi:hypothetical protein